MEFVALWSLLNLGLEADLEKRTWSIQVGPFKISGLKLRTLKSLSDDPSRIRPLLSELFIKPAVMWMDFRRETVADCIKSLHSLENSTGEAAQQVSLGTSDTDRLLASLLQLWSGEAKQARGRLETALKWENDPADSGMDTSAKSELVPALADFRQASFPAVKLLTELLPAEDPVKKDALGKLQKAENDLVKYYGVSTESLSSPQLEPESP